MATHAEGPTIRQVPRSGESVIAHLLQFEAEMRRFGTVPELGYFLANETRRVVPYDQMFVVRRARLGEGFRVEAASSIAIVDRNAPLIQSVERMVADWERGAGGTGQARALTLEASPEGNEPLDDYPFRHWLWHPMRDKDGNVFGGLLAAFGRETKETDIVRLNRVAETAEHAWRALTRGEPVRRIAKVTRKQRRGIAIALIIIALFPVRMSALAPAEVVAARPYVITAPMDGVLAEVAVAPYSPVKKGQLLARFEDVRYRNDFQLAQERLAVAKARVERASSAAFADVANESRDVAIMRAEYQEAEAAYSYAKDMLAKSELIAPRDGVAIYTDRRELEGRALSTGMPIMQVADPEAVELRVDLPVKQQMSLKAGAPVKLWLDSNPLWAVDGELATISYQARQTPDNVTAFTLTARLRGATPQIGSRGTAKVSGGVAPFIYTILRRPIATVRQTIGY